MYSLLIIINEELSVRCKLTTLPYLRYKVAIVELVSFTVHLHIEHCYVWVGLHIIKWRFKGFHSTLCVCVCVYTRSMSWHCDKAGSMKLWSWVWCIKGHFVDSWGIVFRLFIRTLLLDFDSTLGVIWILRSLETWHCVYSSIVFDIS